MERMENEKDCRVTNDDDLCTMLCRLWERKIMKNKAMATTVDDTCETTNDLSFSGLFSQWETVNLASQKDTFQLSFLSPSHWRLCVNTN